MTSLHGFKKHRYELDKPVVFEVEFESGWIEEVLATSAYDAEHKTAHLQSDYGRFKSAHKAKDQE